jgi:hypothetical protein
MKLEINFNIWTAIHILIMCATLILALIIAFQNAQNYYEYNKYISDNQKVNIDFYYSCDNSWDSAFSNCPNELQYKNLTGHYCNQTKTCENGYKLK